MAKIGFSINKVSFLLLLAIVQPQLGFTNQPAPKQEDAISAIRKFVTENPRKAIHLASSSTSSNNADTIALIGTLKAKAYLSLGILDSAKIQINIIDSTVNALVENTLFEIIEVHIQFHLAMGNYGIAQQEIKQQLKKSPFKENNRLRAKLTILKAGVFEHQKQYPEALSTLENGLKTFETFNDKEINALFSRNIANLYFQTDQFLSANNWYSKALENYTELNDTLGQIALIKNISLANRGLSQFDKAETNLQQAQSLAIAMDKPDQLADIYNLMGSLRLRSGKPTESLEYYEQSLILREDLELLSSVASTIENIARVQRDIGEFDKATINLLKVIQIRQELNDSKSLASAYNEMGNLDSQKENFADALMNYLKSLKIRQQANFSEDIARSLTNIGLTYRKIGSYANALKYLEQAIELIDESSDPLSQAYIYVHHGNTLRDVNRSEEAIKSYSTALRLREQTGNKQAIAQAYKSLAYAYGDIKQFGKARELLNNALNITKELGDETRTADIYNELGNLCQQIGNYEEAIDYFQLASTLFAKHFDIDRRALCIRKIGEAQTALGQYQNAFLHLELALNLANKTNNPKLKELTYLALYNYHLKKGEYKEALNFYTQHITLRDSLTNLNKQEAIWQASLDLELNKKVEQIKQIEGEVESLRTEAQLKSVQLEQQMLYRKFIILTLILVVVIAAGSIYGYIVIRKKNKHLGEANEKLSLSERDLKTLVQTKDKLFSIIAHDLRSPLTALLGLTEVLAKQELNPQEVSEFGQHLHESSQKLLTLIDSLLQWSRSQTGKIKLEPKELNLRKLVEEVIAIQQMQADAKKISLYVDIDRNHSLTTDYDTLSTVIRNLLSNGIKFTPESGSISISAAINNKNTTISITDTGVGMKPEDMDKLFRIEDSFSKQGTNQESGTGLGLIICKEFVEMNGGNIDVSSKHGMGTTFTITLPS
jgi:signal transduction histidine kinase/uncharacterized protein HemY